MHPILLLLTHDDDINIFMDYHSISITVSAVDHTMYAPWQYPQLAPSVACPQMV